MPLKVEVFPTTKWSFSDKSSWIISILLRVTSPLKIVFPLTSKSLESLNTLSGPPPLRAICIKLSSSKLMISGSKSLFAYNLFTEASTLVSCSPVVICNQLEAYISAYCFSLSVLNRIVPTVGLVGLASSSPVINAPAIVPP